MPPLTTKDEILAQGSEEKTNVLARHFSGKITFPYPEHKPATLPIMSNEKMSRIATSEKKVEKLLHNEDTRKSTGPDGVCPRLHQRGANEISFPLPLIFNTCLRSYFWPTLWKQSNVTFDKVWHQGLLSKLKSYGGDSELLGLLKNYLLDR